MRTFGWIARKGLEHGRENPVDILCCGIKLIHQGWSHSMLSPPRQSYQDDIKSMPPTLAQSGPIGITEEVTRKGMGRSITIGRLHGLPPLTKWRHKPTKLDGHASFTCFGRERSTMPHPCCNFGRPLRQGELLQNCWVNWSRRGKRGLTPCDWQACSNRTQLTTRLLQTFDVEPTVLKWTSALQRKSARPVKASCDTQV